MPNPPVSPTPESSPPGVPWFSTILGFCCIAGAGVLRSVAGDALVLASGLRTWSIMLGIGVASSVFAVIRSPSGRRSPGWRMLGLVLAITGTGLLVQTVSPIVVDRIAQTHESREHLAAQGPTPTPPNGAGGIELVVERNGIRPDQAVEIRVAGNLVHGGDPTLVAEPYGPPDSDGGHETRVHYPAVGFDCIVGADSPGIATCTPRKPLHWGQHYKLVAQGTTMRRGKRRPAKADAVVSTMAASELSQIKASKIGLFAVGPDDIIVRALPGTIPRSGRNGKWTVTLRGDESASTVPVERDGSLLFRLRDTRTTAPLKSSGFWIEAEDAAGEKIAAFQLGPLVDLQNSKVRLMEGRPFSFSFPDGLRVDFDGRITDGEVGWLTVDRQETERCLDTQQLELVAAGTWEISFNVTERRLGHRTPTGRGRTVGTDKPEAGLHFHFPVGDRSPIGAMAINATCEYIPDKALLLRSVGRVVGAGTAKLASFAERFPVRLQPNGLSIPPVNPSSEYRRSILGTHRVYVDEDNTLALAVGNQGGAPGSRLMAAGIHTVILDPDSPLRIAAPLTNTTRGIGQRSTHRGLAVLPVLSGRHLTIESRDTATGWVGETRNLGVIPSVRGAAIYVGDLDRDDATADPRRRLLEFDSPIIDLVADADRDRVYLSHRSGQVVALGGNGEALVRQGLEEGGGPLGIDTAGNRLFVGSLDGGTITTLELPDLVESKSVLVPQPTAMMTSLAAANQLLLALFERRLIGFTETGHTHMAIAGPWDRSEPSEIVRPEVEIQTETGTVFVLSSPRGRPAIHRLTFSTDATGNPVPRWSEFLRTGPHLELSSMCTGGSLLFVADRRRATVTVYSLAGSGEPLGTVSVGARPVAIGASPDGAQLFIGTAKGKLLVVRTQDALPIAVESLGGPPSHHSLAVTTNGTRIAVVQGDGKRLELLIVSGIQPNRGGIRLRAEDAESGEPIAGVSINHGSLASSTTVSLGDGVHTRALLEEGSNPIIVTAPGYEPFKTSADVFPGTWTDLGTIAMSRTGSA